MIHSVSALLSFFEKYYPYMSCCCVFSATTVYCKNHHHHSRLFRWSSICWDITLPLQNKFFKKNSALYLCLFNYISMLAPNACYKQRYKAEFFLKTYFAVVKVLFSPNARKQQFVVTRSNLFLWMEFVSMIFDSYP